MHHNHEFDWNNIRIMNVERYYNKSLIGNIAYKELQKNGLNLKTDTEGLHYVYIMFTWLIIYEFR